MGLTATTKSRQAELEKQQDDTKEKLRNERRRFNEELRKRQAGLEKKQDATEEKLRNERRRFNEELKKRQDENKEKLLNERRRLKQGQDELSAERLLCAYLQQK